MSISDVPLLGMLKQKMRCHAARRRLAAAGDTAVVESEVAIESRVTVRDRVISVRRF